MRSRNQLEGPDRFLQHMVRYFVGTSVEIAAGRRPFDDFERLLTGDAGSRPVFSAAPGGLHLTGGCYGGEWNTEPALLW